jgi:alginate O-acetyltransferase complex protein AlgI
LERVFLHRVYDQIGKLPSTVITFFIVVIGWVFFRVEKLSDAVVYLKRLFSFNFGNAFSLDSEFFTFFIIAGFFAFFTYFAKGQSIQDKIYFADYTNKRHLAISALVAVLFILSLGSITAFGFNPFIYFRF